MLTLKGFVSLQTIFFKLNSNVQLNQKYQPIGATSIARWCKVMLNTQKKISSNKMYLCIKKLKKIKTYELKKIYIIKKRKKRVKTSKIA